MDWRLIVSPGRVIGASIQPSFKRIGLNSTWLLLTRVAVQAQLFVLTILIARSLGESGFGQYSLIASLIVLGNVFTTFGTDTLLIRQIAQRRRADGSELSAALGLQVILSLLFIAGIWLWTVATPQKSPEFAASLRVFALSLIPLAFFSIYSAVLRGFERMDLYLAASLAAAIAQLIAAWVGVQLDGGLLSLMRALVIVQVFSMGFSFWLCKTRLPVFALHRQMTTTAITHILRTAWPLAVLSVMGIAYQRLGVFMLSYLGSDAQVGLYSAASRIVEALKLGHLAVLGALLPALSALQNLPRGKDTGRKIASSLLTRTGLGLMALALVGAAGVSIFATPLVTMLYGSQFSSAEPLLRILIWLLLPYTISSILTVNMISRGKEKLVMVTLGVSLAAGLALNWLWVPSFGLLGAGLATLAAEFIQAVTLGLFHLVRLV
jgi:O-antigen/teichoic acid export membrane protein